MPIKHISALEQNIESLSKIVTAASKFGVLLGGTCVVGYSLAINHFPQDLSVGDGLLFLMAAACFGVIYVFFTASLVALGVSLSPAVRMLIRLFVWGANSFPRKRKIRQQYEFAPFEWLAVPCAFFSIIMILTLGSRDPVMYWSLPLLSIGLYFFYSIYRYSGIKLKKIETVSNAVLHTAEKETIVQLGNPQNLRKAQLFSVATIFLVPLALGGVTGQLLDAAMRMAHVRVEKAIIYVKEPFASLISKSAVATNRNSPVGYTAFDKISVLFKGFGKTTVISFQDGNTIRNLEIPNDQLIVEEQQTQKTKSPN